MAKWWQDRVIYQIYPRSFCDSNGDGIGDIQGIISKLDYLKSLGIGAIWLSPVYSSPNQDYGYDVADYCSINPEYGTMADMKQLLKEAEKRDLKIVMDLVINHTSDRHRWFQAARKIDSGYRDFYIWKKPRRTTSGKEKPPNNWTSFFTGSAWTKDEISGEYYLHLFSKFQPDLNFENPKVIDEIKKIMKFWLDLGVAGFRCDVINLIYKQSFADGKRRLLTIGSEHYVSTEGCHKILKQFNEEVWQPYDAFIVGEIQYGTLDSVRDFVERNELTIGLSFEHMVFKLRYKADKVKRILQKWQSGVDWNPVFFENHDGMRAVSRFGDPVNFHYQSATMIATLLLTLRGTPFIYQGQEIGMTNVPFVNIKQIKDVVSKSVYSLLRKYFVPSRLAFAFVLYLCRDHARTPMQWDDSLHAGFTTGKPWMMVNPNYKSINVVQSQKNTLSVWNYYQQLLEKRSSIEALRLGKIDFLNSPDEVIIYDRSDTAHRYRVAVNLSDERKYIEADLNGEVVASNYGQLDYSYVKLLRPYEAVILQFK